MTVVAWRTGAREWAQRRAGRCPTRDRRCGEIERRTRHGLAAWGLFGLTCPTRLQPARRADVAWHVTSRSNSSPRRLAWPLPLARRCARHVRISFTNSNHHTRIRRRLAENGRRLGCPRARRLAPLD